MEYSINKLAKLAGISTRTLRYYDEIGLLKPNRISSSGYRIYGRNEVDLLQQILFYRELGISLNEIKEIITAKEYDREKALHGHLMQIIRKRDQIELLIANVTKTIDMMKGERRMSDREKFEGFKKEMLDKNEEQYGEEIRRKYGDDAVNQSNEKLKNMTQEQYERAEQLSAEISKTLKAAAEAKDVHSDSAKKAVELHREWLCLYWPEGMFSPEAHKGLGEMYVADERFRSYYDKITSGGAEFLRDAIHAYYA